MHACLTCGHPSTPLDPFAPCRRCGVVSAGPVMTGPRIGDDDDFGMPGISLGGDAPTDANKAEGDGGASTRELELDTGGDSIGIGIGDGQGDLSALSLDLPDPGVSSDAADLPMPDDLDGGDLDLPTPLEDLDLPTPLEELDLPTLADGALAPRTRTRRAPWVRSSSTSTCSGIPASTASRVERPPTSWTPTTRPPRRCAAAAAEREHHPDAVISLRVTDTGEGASKSLVGALAGLLIVGGAGAAYVTGALDGILGLEADAPAVTQTPQAPPTEPFKGEVAERDPKVLERLALDSPQGFQQAQALAEQQGDRLGEAEAVLLRALRYGPDPVLAAKGLSIADSLAGNPAPEARRIAGLAALVQAQPAKALVALEGEDLRTSLYRAWALAALDRHAEALAILKPSAEKVPATDLAFARTLAELRYETGDDQGREALEQLYEANPDHLGIAESLLKVETEAGELRRAAELAEALPSIETTSDAHQAKLVGARAILAAHRGSFAVANRLFNEAIKRSDALELSLMHMAFLNDIGRYRAARQNIQRMLSDRPDDSHLLYEGARADVAAGEGDTALQKATKLSELGEPLKASTIQSMVLSMRADDAAVEEVLDGVRKTNLSFTEPTLVYARALENRRKYEEALAALDAHLEKLNAASDELPLRRRGIGALHTERARILSIQKRWKEAQAAAREALTASPNDNAPKLLLGTSLIQGGKRAAGEKLLIDLYERTGGFPGLTTPLGRILLNREKLEELEEIIGAQLQKPEDASAEVVVTGARLRLMQGRLEDALSLLDVVLAMDATNWEAHMVKGQALIAKGDHASALIEFEVANPRETSPELETWRGQALEYNSRRGDQRLSTRARADPLYDEAAALYGRQLAYSGSARLAAVTLSRS